MTGRPQHGILVLASCALATALAYALIDRPFAIWSHEHLHGYAIFDRMTLLTGWFPPIAVAIFCATGFAKYLGWRIPKVAEAALLCSVSLVVARAAKDQIKVLFGRTWPETWVNNNPSLIRDGAFGFNPLHGGLGFEAFPSGHMTGICAVIVVLWAYYPRYYAFYLVPVLVISVGLLGANYHFVSDIIAGGFLGASIAVFSMALFSTQESRPVISAEMDSTTVPVIRAKSQSGLSD
jgi:membrane-associated phospholipid phosphatase